MYFIAQRLLDGVVSAADTVPSPRHSRPRGATDLGRHRTMRRVLEERIGEGTAPHASGSLFSAMDEVTPIKDYRDDHVAHAGPLTFPDHGPILRIRADRHEIIMNPAHRLGTCSWQPGQHHRRHRGRRNQHATTRRLAGHPPHRRRPQVARRFNFLSISRPDLHPLTYGRLGGGAKGPRKGASHGRSLSASSGRGAGDSIGDLALEAMWWVRSRSCCRRRGWGRARSRPHDCCRYKQSAISG